MIVHCDQCKSKFRLDDAKVKDAGVKVRCSKCRHIFMVFPEQPKEHSEFDDVLRGFGPATAGAVDSPEQKREFFTNEQDQESFPASDDVSFAVDEPYTDMMAPVGGYSFDDISSDEGAESETPGAEFSGGGVSPGSEFDFSSLLDEPAAPAEETAQQDFQGIDVFDTLGFAPDEPAAVDGGQVENPPMQDGDFPPAEPFSLAAPTTAPEEEEREMMFQDAAEVPVAPEFAEAFSGTEAEGAGDEKANDAVHEETVQTDQSGVATTELPSLPAPSRRRQHSALPLIVTVISIVFVLLLAAGGLLFMKGGPKFFEKVGLGFLPQLMGLQSEDEGSVSVRGMTGAFMENKEAGEIFVVTGEAVNGFRTPRAAIQVRALLYGPDGNIVSRKLAYGGNNLTAEQLKTLPAAKIEAAMNNQFGDSLSNLGVAPGKGIPFVVVFTKVPDKAVDYGVEIAGSTVAGK